MSKLGFIIFILLFSLPYQAKAEFMLSSAIIEFTPQSPRQKDIDLISMSPGDDYLVTEVFEVTKPGTKDEKRILVEDVSAGMLLVTPQKTVLPGQSRKVLRFVLLKKPDDKEHIYRVVIKPVVNEIENKDQIGLKILVGYEVLVIVRPQVITSSYKSKRDGKTLTVTNTGNSSILLQGAQQCKDEQQCKQPPVLRVYANSSASVEQENTDPVTYMLWDGQTNKEAKF